MGGRVARGVGVGGRYDVGNSSALQIDTIHLITSCVHRCVLKGTTS